MFMKELAQLHAEEEAQKAKEKELELERQK